MLKVKICGLTREEDARVAVEAGADLLGFIFVPGTPRAVSVEAASWIRDIPGAETVGVFRNAELETILHTREAFDLDRIQLHGDEPDDWIQRLGSGTIRRVPVAGHGVDLGRIRHLLALGALPLVDPGGGDGVPWDWMRAAEPLRELEVGLAGGLTPATVAAAVATCRPSLVDVSSGVESSPGIKDLGAVRSFVRNARSAVV
jgi:phosphoribosylanthranilate isomerase